MPDTDSGTSSFPMSIPWKPPQAEGFITKELIIQLRPPPGQIYPKKDNGEERVSLPEGLKGSEISLHQVLTVP